jgi:hypothetical protein
MGFACPGCQATVSGSLEAWVLRCPLCGALIRARPLESSGPDRAYEVELAGRPETRRRIEVPWDEEQARSLGAWLCWSSAITLGLVAVLYALARFWR